MTRQSASLITALQKLAADAGTVVEFEARSRSLLAAQLGTDLAGAVVSGDVPPSPHDERGQLAVDAAAMVSVCRELLGSRQARPTRDPQAASTDQSFRLLLDSVGEGVYGADPEGRCTFINARGLQLLGFDHDTQVLGKDMHALVHHTREDGSPHPVAECAIFNAHRENRGVVRDDEVFFRRDGSRFPAEYRSYPIVRNGQVEGSVLTFTDISQRRQIEAEFEQSRSLQRMAGEVVRLGGWSIDLARQEVTWSEELYEILGHRQDHKPQVQESLGRYLLPDRQRVEQALEECAATGVPFEVEARFQTYDDRPVWVRVIGRPRYGSDGTITHISGAFQDIDQIKASTQRAEELGELLTRTLESITDAFWTVDADWRMTYINRRATELLCRSRDELLGVNLWESFPNAVGSVLDEVYHRVMRSGVSEVLEEFYWPPVDLWLDVHVYSSDQGIAVYFRDISDQRKIRHELRERDARVVEQAALLDKARDAIIVCGLDHRVTYWNPGAERLYGYRAEEVLGQCLRELIVSDVDQFDQAMTTLLEHDEWVGESRDVAKDGSEVIVEAHWTLVRDDDGQPASVLSIKSDVTERRRIEQQLLRTQRIESIGTLASGIAHDLNNMLSPILMAVQTLQLSPPDEPDGHLLSIIEQSARRGADLVRQVVSFASGGDGERREIDLKELIDQTIAILRETFPRNIEIHCEDPASLPRVLGDPTQVQQVLVNLCLNARDATPEGGHLRIGLDVTTVTDDEIAHECPPGQYLSVSVEDTGIGMDPQTMERIFEPFYTTRPQGQGTGLGLSISHGIVRRHGGFIQVISTPGAGSTFIVHLPLASSPVSPPAATSAGFPHGAGQLLLLIEDDDNVRTVTRRTLEAHGYRVIVAGDGREALPVFDDHQEEIAAVITDMMMPHMDGPTTIKHLRARTPTIPILAISGLAIGPDATQSELGITRFLAKPFSRNDIITAVSQLLTSDSPTEAGRST